MQADYRNAEQKLQAQQRRPAELCGLCRAAGELISQNKDQVTAACEGEIQALEALRDKKFHHGGPAHQPGPEDPRRPGTTWSRRRRRQTADPEVLQLNEQGRLKKQAQAVKAYSDALQQQQDALALQGQRAAAAVGMGAQQRRLFDQRGSLDDRFAQQRLTWRASTATARVA
ncbi:hypothetical protein QT611_05410 [Pseudomonas aeruginosa]|nr:hypothetical protein [Pseudomonas aeruginosa]